MNISYDIREGFNKKNIFFMEFSITGGGESTPFP